MPDAKPRRQSTDRDRARHAFDRQKRLMLNGRETGLPCRLGTELQKLAHAMADARQRTIALQGEISAIRHHPH
jgi:hypothetical protein